MGQVVSFTTWLLYLQVKPPWYLLKRLDGPQSWSWCFRGEKTILSLLGTEPWSVQTRAYLLNRLHYPGFLGATGILIHNFFFTWVNVLSWVVFLLVRLQLVCCDTDRDSNHIPDKQQRLLPLWWQTGRSSVHKTHVEAISFEQTPEVTAHFINCKVHKQYWHNTSNCQCSKIPPTISRIMLSTGYQKYITAMYVWLYAIQAYGSCHSPTLM